MEHVAEAILATMALAIVAFVPRMHLGETPTDRTYRPCGDCGLEPIETAELINTLRHSTLSGDEKPCRINPPWRDLPGKQARAPQQRDR